MLLLTKSPTKSALKVQFGEEHGVHLTLLGPNTLSENLGNLTEVIPALNERICRDKTLQA